MEMKKTIHYQPSTLLNPFILHENGVVFPVRRKKLVHDPRKENPVRFTHGLHFPKANGSLYVFAYYWNYFVLFIFKSI